LVKFGESEELWNKNNMYNTEYYGHILEFFLPLVHWTGHTLGPFLARGVVNCTVIYLILGIRPGAPFSNTTLLQ
jgi:hypothetical protein